jgi:serine protease Do
MVAKTKGFIAGAAVGAVGAAAAAALASANLAQPQRTELPAAESPQLIRAQNVTPALARPPAGAPLSFADIVERVSPAVVSLEVRGRPQGRSLRGIPGFENFPFDILPRAPGQGQGQGQGQGPGGGADGEEGPGPDTQASGSGFFISADGYIVTNNHVVENAREINVILSDERELPARVVGRDEDTDLAVLKVEGRNFPYVSFATQAQPRVGDWVIAVGNPFQLGNTATAGIVSARGREIGDTAYVNYLQIDAPINRGNSGGPTFDIQGQVIGVNTAIYSTTGGSQGIGFAIPADVADQIVRQLISGGRITRGYVGVSIGDVSKEVAESLGLRADQGALIARVEPGGPGARGGLQAGDVVTRVNGQPIKNANELTRRVATVRPGESIRLDVYRNGQNRTVTVTSGARPTREQLAARDNETEGADTPNGPAQVRGPAVLGMNLSALDEATRRRYSIDSAVRGVVIERVDPASDAGDKGVRRGDVITRINDREISSTADVQAAIEAARRLNRPSALVWINRGGDVTPLPIRLQPRAG